MIGNHWQNTVLLGKNISQSADKRKVLYIYRARESAQVPTSPNKGVLRS